ncbi:MAG TPA: hypothetical protein VGL35_01280 [Rhizomicrobium sp.]|jgi:F0F1-type ATP synthase membrane subunit b/b'
MNRREKLLQTKRFRVDSLRRQVTTLGAMAGDVERKLADLEEAIARERQRANDSSMGRLALPSVLRAMDERRDNLNATLREIGRERAQVELELDKTSGEVRNVEMEVEQASNRAAEASLSRQRMPLHELALARQLRRHALRQI